MCPWPGSTVARVCDAIIHNRERESYISITRSASLTIKSENTESESKKCMGGFIVLYSGGGCGADYLTPGRKPKEKAGSLVRNWLEREGE